MTGKITIRKATRDDAPAIHELHTKSVRQLCRDHYSNKQINEWLNHRSLEKYLPVIDRGEVFVATEGPVIVGYGRAVPGEVVSIFVSPDRIKKGIGSMLFNHAIEIAKGSSDKVILDASLNSIDFYRKRGFVEVQEIFIKRGDIELPCVRMEYRATT